MDDEQNTPTASTQSEEPEPVPGIPKNEEETTLGQKGFEEPSKEFHTNIQGDVKVSSSGDHATYNVSEIHHHYQGQTEEQTRQQTQISEDFKQIKEQFEELKAQFGEREGEESPDAPPNRKKAARWGGRFQKKLDEDIPFTENDDDSSIKVANLPKTGADLAKWYYKLSIYDKCFVQAMAIFDG